MTSYERIMTALSGEKTDRVPVMLFNRDWTMQQVGFNSEDMMKGVERFVFAQFHCALEFGYDAVQDPQGVNAESEALGCTLRITPESPPAVIDHPVEDYERDMPNIKILDPYQDARLPLILEDVRRLKELSARRIAVNPYIQAPFRSAAMLRGNDIYKDLLKRRERVFELLEKTLLSQIAYGVALVNAGADVLTISDPTSSGDVISRSQWLDFGHTYLKELVKHLRATKAKIYLHICGDNNDRLDTFSDLNLDGISFGEKVDLEAARKSLGDQICIIGNVSPANLLHSSPEEIAEESRMCIDKAGKNGSFILCSGCGISKNCPPENIRAMVRVAREYRY